MKYVFTQDQLQIMIALCGIERCPFLGQPREMKNAEMVQAIARLYQSGCIEEQGGRMLPAPRFQAMLQTIASAEEVISFWFGEGHPTQHLVCPAARDEIVILEKESYTVEPVFKLWQEPAAIYLHDLFEMGLLPRCMNREREKVQPLEEMAWRENPPVRETLHLLSRVESTMTRSGQLKSLIEVGQSTVFRWLYCLRGEEEFYHLYSEEELAELLREEMRGSTK